MAASVKMDWDERYAVEGYAYGKEPNAFLRTLAPALKPGMKVLMPGDGEGRNGVFLAGLGLDVLSVDQSRVGLAKAGILAREKGALLRTEQADLAAWNWPENAYDLAGLFFLHLPQAMQPVVHQGVAKALKSGGLLAFEAFHPDNLPLDSGGPKDPSMLYTPGQLRAAFPGFDFEILERAEIRLAEGAHHHGRAVVTRALARKP